MLNISPTIARRDPPTPALRVFFLVIALLVLFSSQAVAQDDSATDASTLVNRHRLDFRVGLWNADHLKAESSTSPVQVKTSVEDLMGAFAYAYRVQEHLATHLTFSGLVSEVSSITGPRGVTDNTVVLSSALFGVRYYPVTSTRSPLQPYFSLGMGPYIGVESTSQVGLQIIEKTRVLGTFGGQLGGGLDLQLGRHFMAGINLGYNLMADFSEPLAGRENYNGFEASAGLSVLFGG
jgi:hypothetical protein